MAYTSTATYSNPNSYSIPMEQTTASGLSFDELNSQALDAFIYQPVSRDMIKYLARAAREVISCDPYLKPQDPPTAVSSPSKPVRCSNGGLPSLADFITQLVVTSNVQVPTLMSTLVYLHRLRSRLAPMAKGLRCTTHRIFLAALIIAAKYLNDSSPKNKHWANYSVLATPDAGAFGFSRTEVNLMERQLLMLLDYDLRFTTEDLYRELEPFLSSLRVDIDLKHARRQRRKEEYAARQAAPAALPTPPSSRGSSRTRNHPSIMEATIRCVQDPESPASLTYSASTSSSSSYVSSMSSRQSSRETTPLSDHGSDGYVYVANSYASPEVVVHPPGRHTSRKNTRLPYEISEADLMEMEGAKGSKRQRIWGKILGGAN
ncbi:putative cyclin domain-containing protein [Zalerion maritima]|uniref:Cyclin domain-containing protein n=1 Tax=Zalerion maritima TaxID=339359 RepID=A0AAD5RVY0_9PEZI|nr:putative cyclin domain-containing protein [Zalerion maritima]